MKKRIISLLLLGMYFLGGFGMVFAADAGVSDAEFNKADYNQLKEQGISSTEASKMSGYNPSD